MKENILYMDHFISLEQLNTTQENVSPAASPETIPAYDALVRSLNERGTVDMRYICQLCGMGPDQAAAQLGTQLLQDPEIYAASEEDPYAGWVLRSEYLSGSLLEKLWHAQDAEQKYHRFSANLAALQAALPEHTRIDDIYIGIGAPFIPPEIATAFVKDLMKTDFAEIFWSQVDGLWKVWAYNRRTVRAITRYGTAAMCFYDIFEHLLNSKQIAVYDHTTDSYGKDVTRLNVKETNAALHIAEEIRKLFDAFCRRPENAAVLEEHYYEQYGSYGARTADSYDPDMVTLPGLNPAVSPYTHQKRGVLRAMLQKNLLLNYDTGTGKTDTMIEAGHELVRLNLSSRILYVVPNEIFQDFTARHRYLYPMDQLLLLPPAEMCPAKRQRAFEKIISGEYAFIYMAASSFDRIHLSMDLQLKQLADEIRQLRVEHQKLRDDPGTPNRTRLLEAYRMVEDRKERSLEKLFRKAQEQTPDPYPFEALGITTLIVDEVHHYKNVSTTCHTTAVTGMNRKGSHKCDSMLQKVRYVQEHGRGAIFATGTPMTNSIADLFTLQRYLQPETLNFLRISGFDSWISTFGEQTTELEIDVDSNGYRMKTRISRFHNLPELAAIFSEVCDHYHVDRDDLPVDRRTISVPESPWQQKFIRELSQRTDNIRNHCKKDKKDNLLKITSEGRMAALDMRLLKPDAPYAAAYAKIEACARECAVRYRCSSTNTQLVFCDIGTPKEGFNVYDALKEALMGFGIPGHEIAYIQSAHTEKQRAKLFAQVNAAEVRIVIGSTPMLGEGVNVQKYLCAVHNLDLPWRPADMIQRVGRMQRTGNTTEAREVLYYLTEGTFDAYNLQLLENKQHGIDELLSAACHTRSAGDIGDTVLSYAEIKALCVGNPLLKQRIQTELAYKRLLSAKYRDQAAVRDMQTYLACAAQEKAQIEKQIQAINSDIAAYRKRAIFSRMSKKDREKAGNQLQRRLQECCGLREETQAGTFMGFRIVIPAFLTTEKPFVFLRGQSSYKVELSEDGKSAGHYTRLENRLKKLPEVLEQQLRALRQKEQDITDAQRIVNARNSYEVKLEQLKAELKRLDKALGLDQKEGA